MTNQDNDLQRPGNAPVIWSHIPHPEGGTWHAVISQNGDRLLTTRDLHQLVTYIRRQGLEYTWLMYPKPVALHLEPWPLEHGDLYSTMKRLLSDLKDEAAIPMGEEQDDEPRAMSECDWPPKDDPKELITTTTVPESQH